VSIFTDFWGWFTTGANWHGSDGIPARLSEHVQYCLLALALASAVGIPIGLLTGHFRRGGLAVTALSTAARALPTLGILYVLASYQPLAVFPVILVLAALGLPSILVNTYTGVVQADPDAVDAARGMGMRPSQVLLRVELPSALPLIWLGIRLAAFQVVSTATIAAFVSLGGLGNYIRFGLATRDYPQVVGGAVLTVVLALLSLLVVSLAARLTVSKGIRARS
jgi:osmoprotectant transport system permease protein